MPAPNRSTAALVVALIAAALAPAGALAQDLELRRVMLSAGGVGYFEYEARVQGDATLELSVRLDQVDDVMKSVVVFDDSGTAGTIRLAGRDPVEQIFRDLPFGPDALGSPVALLNALPGARIRATGARQIEGRLVRVVAETDVVGDTRRTVTRHRVSVLAAGGLQTFILEDADAVSFTDPELAEQVEDALAAVSAHRARDRRTLEITSAGEGVRAVRVGYVVSAPLWKASYRLSLGDGDAARLQGWAVLENMSGQDWDGVELTLVSGNPVTFRQALYAAYYADRPEVPVEVLGRVLPSPDTGAVAAAPAAAERAARQALEQASAGRAQRLASPVVGALAADSLRDAPAPAAAPAPEPAPVQAGVVAAASTEAATSVRFRVPYPVTVGSGQSLLVPVIDRSVPAERIALFQPATHPRHPLAAVRLRNDGETGLPPGVLTLYETDASGSAFVGDAQLSPLPAGEERLVSYALDQKTLVDREVETTQTISKGRIYDGLFELTRAQEQWTVYRIKAPATEPRTVLVEHPRAPGWKLEQPDEGAATLTEGHYRIGTRLDAGETRRVPVVLGRPLVQTIALLDAGTAQLARYASTGELEPELRRAFRAMADLRRAVDAERRRLEELEQARVTIGQEQERIRNNLGRVPRDSDLHKRYLRKLDTQEDRLERLHREAEGARDALEQARAALADYIRGLDL